MNRQRLLVLGCAILATLLILASSPYAEQAPKPIIWQYRVVDAATIQAFGATSENRLEAGLNELGKKGWELTVIEQGTKNPRFYFKRNAGV